MSAVLFIVMGELAFALWATRRLELRERRFALVALAFHIASSFGQYALQEYYYRGDAFGYLESGADLARLLDFDFLHFAPEVLRLAAHLDADLPFHTLGAGSSTGTMSALAGFSVWAFGPSLLPACLVTTIVGWFGQLCLYRVAREELAPNEKTAALVGCLLVPSVVFWGSAFAKEAFALGPFGLLALSSHQFFRKRGIFPLIGVLLGGLGVALFKAYILFPYVIAVASWIYAERIQGSDGTLYFRPAYLVLALTVALGGIAGIATIFPEFGVGRIAETVADQQGNWLKIGDSGSVVEMGSEEARSLSGQLPFVPLALANALFRPLIFEARNGPMLGAAIETTALAFGVIRLLWQFSWARTRAAVLRSPPLVFSVVFILSFGLAVGLATSNLGSLSRYRVPMMPFYVTTLLVLGVRLRTRALEATQNSISQDNAATLRTR